MRAAAIFGLGCSEKDLKPFRTDKSIDWLTELPSSSAQQADIILVFGGDGTVHRHLSRLVELETPVLIVPSGSGNDFARALGLHSVRDALGAWRRFCTGENNVRCIDLGTIQPTSEDAKTRNSVLGIRHHFCSIAGLGLDAEVTRRANGLPRWLRANGGYMLSLFSTVFRFSPLPIQILVPDEQTGSSTRSRRPTLLAAFANTSTYGDGMKIAPRAKMDDGQLDVCVIGSIHPFKLACMFLTVYFGRHLDIRGVEYFRAQRVRVETEMPADIFADGEYVCRTPAEIGVHSKALRIVTP